MKHTYIAPSIKAINVESTEILAGSGNQQMNYAGSNSQSGAPTVAESKYRGDFDWDEE